MTAFNLRSLLVAAIVLSNCITWTASRHHYTHNIHNHRTRHRRQGAGLFLSGSYIVPGGEGDGWGEWGEDSPCSRTCGGGVASQKRICLRIGPDGQPQCSGGDTRYFSCQTQDCPSDSDDFRAQQCAEFNDQEFRGYKYEWVPYTRAPNPCELNCMPRGERFYYKHKAKVIDGTRCNDDSFDVCVDGVCRAVGCDMMLGSNAREDKCRECRGTGAKCNTISNLIDSPDFIVGYNDLLLIPARSTSISIEEIAPSNNYLALRSANNTYYLNGDYHIDFPRNIMIGGAMWSYERSQSEYESPDKLKSLGPTNEPLYLSLLVQSKNVGIKYEYSIPNDVAPPTDKRYNWVHEDFTPCNATCGGGIQTRYVTCRSSEELDVVDDGLCDEGLKPPTSQTCGNDPCPAEWVEGPWGDCSKRCGNGGIRKREVTCQKIIANGIPSLVTDKECFDHLGPKPELFQECNRNATCPTWFVGPWKACDKLCDEGKQTREVVCHQKTNGCIETLEDDECEDEKPATEKPCMMAVCEGVDWVASDWTKCDSCQTKVRTRTVLCVSKERQVYNDSLCGYHKRPITEEPCEELPECAPQWYASFWSKCSVDCGEGVQTRGVFCGKYDGETVSKVSDELCADQPKYNDTKPCVVPKEKCPVKWFAGPWGPCTAKCNTGEQHRLVMCFRSGENATDCTIDDILETSQLCNTHPCISGEEDLIPVFEEVGLDALSTTMMSDSPSGYAEHESSPSTEDGSGSGSGFSSTIEGSGSSEDYYTDFSSTTDEGSGSTEDTSSETGSSTTDSSSSTDTESTVTEVTESGATDKGTGSTESEGTATTESGGTATTESGGTATTESGGTATTESGGTATTESGGTATTESGATGSDGTATTESGGTGTTESEGTATTESGGTASTESEGTATTESGGTATTESEGTATTESGATDKGTASTESEGTATTESGATASTESEGTATTESGGTATTESEGTATTESGATEETATTGTEESTSDSTTDTATTDSDSTEPSSTESSEATSTPATGSTDSSTGTEETSSTDTSTTESSDTKSTSSDTTPTDATGTTQASTTPDETTSSEVSSESSSTGTESSTTDSSTSSGSESTTEGGSTTESNTTEGGSSSTGSESTDTTVSGGSTESVTTPESTESSTGSTGTATEVTAESGSTTESTTAGSESTATEGSTTEGVSGSTETEGTTESSGTTETGSTEESTTGSTTEFTGSTVEVTEDTSSTDTTTEGTSTTPSVIETSTPSLSETAPTTECSTKTCKAKKKPACEDSDFGCCPDKKTAAKGPFDAGCPKPRTCKEAAFGCCPDGVSPAEGENNEGCPVTPCEETLYGCCPDGKTAAGPYDKGCPNPRTWKEAFGGTTDVTPIDGDGYRCPPPPPPCASSEFGCCADEETEATGPDSEGCPESTTETPSTITETESTGTDTESTQTGTESSTTDETTSTSDSTSDTESETTSEATTPSLDCASAEFGCCHDNETAASGPDGQGCPCTATEFGCCPDGETSAQGENNKGCEGSCRDSIHGCCPDGETPAHGPDSEGCCLLSPFGCCPDNRKPAEGPHLEGCGCQHAQYGCCPDNVTSAQGPKNEGCGCQYTEFGCCPDRHTTASGPEFKGCSCHTFQFGCCPDGVTVSRSPGLQNCRCQDSEFGCCGDEETAATGPNKEGCDCSNSKHGCCPDGQTEATGDKFLGCKDQPENIQAVCSLPTDPGPCTNYAAMWFYDLAYGGCSRFWYGGCEGNGNKFATKEDCEDICVQPAPKDACKLPGVKGPCVSDLVRWYFNSTQEQCQPFRYGGCLGNANNFDTRELCQTQCEPQNAGDKCKLPIERGSCAGNFSRWGYNSDTQRCEPFEYGGCEGNNNRFNTEAACQMGCGPGSKQPDKCTLPAETGECAEYRERWFYDTSIKRCRQFYYGGCGGNGNNFGTEAECESSCAEREPQAVTTTTLRPTLQPVQPPEAPSYCFFEIDEGGRCSVAEEQDRFAYDSSLGKCVQFHYLGCGGNQNNFPDLDYCTYYCHPVQDICQLPMLSGPCEASIMSWFYDPATDSCSQFTYGGCEGNDNRFESREACESRCRTGPTPTTTTTTTSAPPNITAIDGCSISSTLEECQAPGLVWYVDPNEHACVSHTNRETGQQCRHTGTFESEEACERRCGAFKDIDPCTQQLDAGPCKNMQTKVYYDQESRTCKQFTYGGCHGGANRFSTIEECAQVCNVQIDVCSLPPEQGLCYLYETLWYYDPSVGGCREFVYSGCGGNENRFESRQECEARCSRPKTTTTTAAPILPPEQLQCSTPTPQGPCDASQTVYFFDPSTDRCLVSQVGYCGHPNAYRTEEECLRQCGSFRSINACRAPMDPGPCRAAFPKYFFNALKGTCDEFIYGGCAGGPNMFSSPEECHELCGGHGPEEPDCEPYEQDCLSIEQSCPYGVGKVPESGCQRCVCNPDPCLSARCTADEHCVAYAYQDPDTHEPRYGAKCQAIDDNNIIPRDCSGARQACNDLRCPYGKNVTFDGYGCEICNCLESPCVNMVCGEGEQCVDEPYRDPISQGIIYTGECRKVVKPGECPADTGASESDCAQECSDDSHCRGEGKCCVRGCSRVCLPPVTNTTPYGPEPPGPPRVDTHTEPEVSVSEGGKATLRCLFHGNPPPKITWRRGELTIESDMDRYRLTSEGALEIVSLYRNDSGVYICVADNGLGKAEQEVNLVVTVPVAARISAPYTTLTAGTSLRLACDVDGYPEPTVQWTKDGARIGSDDRISISGSTVSRLSISSAVVSDSGVYGCYVDNGYTSHSDQVEVVVRETKVPAKCTDNPFFADCQLIVRSKFCNHQYYSKFCCKSCVEAGQLDPMVAELQADQPYRRK